MKTALQIHTNKLLKQSGTYTIAQDEQTAFMHNVAGAHARGLKLMIDGLEVYCQAHKEEFSNKIANDYVLGPACADIARALRTLLNGAGKFDGGTLDSAILEIAENAGFIEEIV